MGRLGSRVKTGERLLHAFVNEALMRGVAGGRCGVKASGGIRTLADVKTMLDAGANRIGASASVNIVRELGAE